MNKEWHINIPLPHEQWATPEGDKTLCWAVSRYMVRFEFYENFAKAHVLKQQGVCQKCRKLFEQEMKRSKDRG